MTTICLLNCTVMSGTAIISTRRRPPQIVTSSVTSTDEPAETSTIEFTSEPVVTDTIIPAVPSEENPKNHSISPNPSQTVTNDPMDPTDYSTVWPTRWRPRGKRFGAEGGEAQTISPPKKWLLIILTGAFIGGILF